MLDYTLTTSPQMRRRHAAEKRFQWYGRTAIALSLAFLVFMFVAIIYRGAGAFQQSQIGLNIHFDEQIIDPQGARDAGELTRANYKPLIKKGLAEIFPDVTERRENIRLYRLVSSASGFELGERVASNPELIGTTDMIWLSASSEVDLYMKGKIDETVPENLRRLKDRDIAWVETLISKGLIKKSFNKRFFQNGDSRDPVMAGILGAAAVPSIVFGLLGLAIFLNFFELPRSTPLVGGMVLALMAMPTIIIASRSILRSIPNSIRDAALGLGASKTQATFHHVVPLAMPGMLTGTILGMARALGETAPLLMIGMVAFIVDIPKGVTDVATALPVQIFLWADSPEKGFVERTSAAIIVLLAFLIIMNLAAVYMRRKLERRW